MALKATIIASTHAFEKQHAEPTRDTGFPCAPATVLPKTDAFACGAAVCQRLMPSLVVPQSTGQDVVRALRGPG